MQGMQCFVIIEYLAGGEKLVLFLSPPSGLTTVIVDSTNGAAATIQPGVDVITPLAKDLLHCPKG